MPAATATTRRAAPPAKALKERRALARERLDIDIRLAPDYAEIARLDAALKKIATDAGASFKEDFGADGSVAASGAVAAEYKGEVPVIVTEKWTALSPAKREQLVESGLVKIEQQYGRASSGRVTVKML